MPSYIFTRVRQFPSSWELLEASQTSSAAEKLLANYRSALGGKSDVEVTLIEAADAHEARHKLEFDPNDEPH